MDGGKQRHRSVRGRATEFQTLAGNAAKDALSQLLGALRLDRRPIQVCYLVGRRRVLCGSELPEFRHQADPGESPLKLGPYLRPPVGAQPVVIPDSGQLPSSIHRQERSHRQLCFRFPTLYVFFRPEEKNGASREANVVPPLPSRNDKSHLNRIAQQPAVSNL